MSNGALGGNVQPRQADIARIRQRISRTAAELSYDIVVWIWGMLAAAWVTRDLPDAVVWQSFSWHVAAAICVLSPAAGRLAGLYQSRYQRGSLDEVIGIAAAALGTCAALAALTHFIVPDQRAPLATSVEDECLGDLQGARGRRGVQGRVVREHLDG